MSSTDHPVVHTRCRICGSALAPVLTLGPQWLSDFPASPDTRAHQPVPLDLARCTRDTCGLVQLVHTTPAEWLYRHFWYRSGVNETMRLELAHVVARGLDYAPRPAKGLVVGDIGANDGYLLSTVPEIARVSGHTGPITRVAWEPARNLYQACRPHAEILFPDYFRVGASGEQGAVPRWDLPVHLLTMIACFYDVEDPHALVADAAAVLHAQGVWVIQQAYLPAMLAASDYTNICHEHLAYYHLRPLEALLLPYGLEVFHVEARSINGGSFRAYVGHVGRHPVQPSVAAMRAAEAGYLEDPAAAWGAFNDRVQVGILRAREVLEDYAAAGKRVDLLGASTKGNTLLQVCRIDARLIRQAWERSQEKWGRYVGTSGIPIVSEEDGRADPPDALFALIWQFREGLVAREAAYLAKGGEIVFPLPQVEVVGAAGVRR